MTITTNDDRDEYTASSGQTVFSYTFKIYDSTDLNVYQTPSSQDFDDSTDLITAYTVANVGEAAGGTITLSTGATAGDRITIVSAIPSSRTTDYQVNGDFTPSVVNDDFDRLVSLAKQAEGLARRAPKFSESRQGVSEFSLPKPIANTFWRVNAGANGMEAFTANGAAVTAEIPVSGYAELRALTSSSYTDGQVITVTSDGVAGHFVIKTGSVTDNSGTLIVFTDDSNRYAERIFDGEVSVKWFGAVGDGVTDDAAAIRAARDFAEEYVPVEFIDRGTNVLIFPEGNYLCNSVLGYIPCSCRGQNKTRTKIIYSGSAARFIEFGDATYQDLKFVYTNASLTGDFTRSTFPATFTNCFWSGEGLVTSADSLINLDRSLECSFESCLFADAQHCVIGQVLPGGFCNGTSFNSCTFGNYVFAIFKDGGQAWRIDGCIFEFSTTNEVNVVITSGTAEWFGLTITGCWFGDNTALTSHPYLQWKGNGLLLAGNYINGNGTSSPTVLEVSGTSDGVSITGNYISNFTRVIEGGGNLTNLFMFGNDLNAITSASNGYTAPYFVKDIDSTYNKMSTLNAERLNVGTDVNQGGLHILSSEDALTGSAFTGCAYIEGIRSLGVGTGAGLAFGGEYNSSNERQLGGGIRIGKTNATDGNFSFNLEFWARNNGADANKKGQFTDTGVFEPGTDNTQTLGSASFRWSEVFAGIGTINTSDAREKQQVRSITEAEENVAKKCKGLLKAFKFNDAVASKGDKARIHIGIIAQELAESFVEEGLDPHNYSMFCYDEWDSVPDTLNEDGEVITPGKEAGSRFGIRYDELLAFIIASI